MLSNGQMRSIKYTKSVSENHLATMNKLSPHKDKNGRLVIVSSIKIKLNRFN